MSDETDVKKDKKPALARKPAAGKSAAPRTAKPAEKKTTAPVTVVKKPSRAVKPADDKPQTENNFAAILNAKKTDPVRDYTVAQIGADGRAYATGKRKNAIARVWIKPGKGAVSVNGRELAVYFGRPTQQMLINQALQIANREGQYDIFATVVGGGLSGQAGAVRHGLAKALTFYEPDLRPVMKKAGLLTRDSRIVERKKYGRHKARRSTQWVKR